MQTAGATLDLKHLNPVRAVDSYGYASRVYKSTGSYL